MSGSMQLSFLASVTGQGAQIGQTLVNGRARPAAESGLGGFSQLLFQQLNNADVNFTQASPQTGVNTELAGLAAPGRLLPGVSDAPGNRLPVSAAAAGLIDPNAVNTKASDNVATNSVLSAFSGKNIETAFDAKHSSDAALSDAFTRGITQTDLTVNNAELGRVPHAANSATKLGSGTELEGFDSVSFEAQALNSSFNDSARSPMSPLVEQSQSAQASAALSVENDAQRLAALRSSKFELAIGSNKRVEPTPLDSTGLPRRNNGAELSAQVALKESALNQKALGGLAPLTDAQLAGPELGSKLNAEVGLESGARLRAERGNTSLTTQSSLLTSTSVTAASLSTTATLASTAAELQADGQPVNTAVQGKVAELHQGARQGTHQAVGGDVNAAALLQKDSFNLNNQAFDRVVTPNSANVAGSEKSHEPSQRLSGSPMSTSSSAAQQALLSSLQSLTSKDNAVVIAQADPQALSAAANARIAAERASSTVPPLQQASRLTQALGVDGSVAAAAAAANNTVAGLSASEITLSEVARAGTVSQQTAESVSLGVHNKVNSTVQGTVQSSAETAPETQRSTFSNELPVRELQAGKAAAQNSRDTLLSSTVEAASTPSGASIRSTPSTSTTSIPTVADTNLPAQPIVANTVNTVTAQNSLLPLHRQSAYSVSLDKNVSGDTGSLESNNLSRHSEPSLDGIARPITSPAALSPQFGSSTLNSAEPLNGRFALNLAQAQSKFANSIPQIGQRIQWMLGSGAQSADIQIDPPELGPLQIQVSSDDKQASVSFVANSSAARELIEANLPRLREHLESLGLELGETSVNQQEQQAASDSQFTDKQTAVDDDAAGAELSDEASELVGPHSSGGSSTIDAYA